MFLIVFVLVNGNNPVWNDVRVSKWRQICSYLFIYFWWKTNKSFCACLDRLNMSLQNTFWQSSCSSSLCFILFVYIWMLFHINLNPQLGKVRFFLELMLRNRRLSPERNSTVVCPARH